MVLNFPVQIRNSRRALILFGVIYKPTRERMDIFARKALEQIRGDNRVSVVAFSADILAISLALNLPHFQCKDGCCKCHAESSQIERPSRRRRYEQPADNQTTKRKKERRWMVAESTNFEPRTAGHTYLGEVCHGRILVDGMHLLFIGLVGRIFLLVLANAKTAVQDKILREIGSIRSTLPSQNLPLSMAQWKAKDYVVLLAQYFPRLFSQEMKALLEKHTVVLCRRLYKLVMMLADKDADFDKARTLALSFHRCLQKSFPSECVIKLHYLTAHFVQQCQLYGPFWNHWLFNCESMYGDGTRKMPINSNALRFFVEKAAYFASRKAHVRRSIPTRFFFLHPTTKKLYYARSYARGRRSIFKTRASAAQNVVSVRSRECSVWQAAAFSAMSVGDFYTSFEIGHSLFFVTPNFPYLFHD